MLASNGAGSKRWVPFQSLQFESGLLKMDCCHVSVSVGMHDSRTAESTHFVKWPNRLPDIKPSVGNISGAISTYAFMHVCMSMRRTPSMTAMSLKR